MRPPALKEKHNIKFVESQIIKKTHGFVYEDHFRHMLIRTIGIINVERVEKKVDGKKLTKLLATLDTLKAARNPEAHTHIKGTTRHINAPSVTLGQFTAVYDGLIEFELLLKTTKF